MAETWRGAWRGVAGRVGEDCCHFGVSGVEDDMIWYGMVWYGMV